MWAVIFGNSVSYFSRIDIQHDPKKIARKRFMLIFCCIWSGEEHTKSWTKSEHGFTPKNAFLTKMAANNGAKTKNNIYQVIGKLQ